MKVKVERGDDGVDKHPMCELCGEEFTLGTLDIRRDAGESDHEQPDRTRVAVV